MAVVSRWRSGERPPRVVDGSGPGVGGREDLPVFTWIGPGCYDENRRVMEWPDGGVQVVLRGLTSMFYKMESSGSPRPRSTTSSPSSAPAETGS